MSYTRKITRLNKTFLVSIPKDLLLKYGWNKDDEIELNETDNGIILKKVNGKIIFTIGYESLDIDEFIKILKENSIKQLIDVREIAFSRKNGFSKSILSSTLAKNGIKYRHYSELGSPKNVRKELFKTWDYRKFFSEYKKYINDRDIQQTIEDIELFAGKWKTVLMCFEKDKEKCHRKILADILEKKEWKISDLRDRNKRLNSSW